MCREVQNSGGRRAASEISRHAYFMNNKASCRRGTAIEISDGINLIVVGESDIAAHLRIYVASGSQISIDSSAVA